MRTVLLFSVAVVGAVLWRAPARAEAACELTRAPAAAGGARGQPIAAGIRYEEVAVRCPADTGFLGPETATAAHVVEVDLGAPGVSVRTSQPGAAACPADPGAPGQGGCFAAVLPTSVFAGSRPAAGGALPQVVVNANAFVTCCSTGEPARPTLVRGLEIADARTNNRTLGNDQPKPPTPLPASATFASSLLIDGAGHASIWTADDTTGAPGGVVTAVTGSHQILKSRTINVARCDDVCTGWLGLNARTAVGVADGDRLIMAVLDGRDGGAGGVTLNQAADVLRQLGAVDAIALDGGGSSVMARRDGDDGYAVLSKLADAPAPGETCTVPKGATADCERYVGNVLTVFAPPAPPAR